MSSATFKNRKSQEVVYFCGVCQEECQGTCIYCDNCKKWFHSKCENLSEDALKHESTLQESFQSRDSYENKLKEFEDSLQHDYVPRTLYEETLQQYQHVLKQLENEKFEHSKTKQKLQDTEAKLDFADGEIEVLGSQLQREKQAFEQAFHTIKNKASKENAKNCDLKSKYSAISKKCENQNMILQDKVDDIKYLEHKLKETDEKYRKQMSELDVQKKQEQYIAKMLEEKDQKKSSRMKSSLPEAKS